MKRERAKKGRGRRRRSAAFALVEAEYHGRRRLQGAVAAGGSDGGEGVELGELAEQRLMIENALRLRVAVKVSQQAEA